MNFSILITLGMMYLSLAAPVLGNPLSGQKINICDDGAEWPPYTYYERTESGEKTDRLKGFSVELIQRILDKEGISFEIKLVPWKRCLKCVKEGRSFQMALNASFSKERQANYHMTRPFYHTTNYYFYSKRNYPGGLVIDSVFDLYCLNACGLLGYNYETYGLSSHIMDQGAKCFPALIAKLHKGRCDVFVEKYEIMAGFTAIGSPMLSDPDIGFKPIPGMKTTPFHMLVSKQLPFGKVLVERINQGIKDIQVSGELDRMLKSYIP